MDETSPDERGVRGARDSPPSAGDGRVERIALLDDTARFRVDDPDDLVAASFACPGCLGSQVEVVVTGEDDEHTAGCSCRMCGAAWNVGLTTWQVVRLRVHPPGRAAVHGFGLRLRERH